MVKNNIINVKPQSRKHIMSQNCFCSSIKIQYQNCLVSYSPFKMKKLYCIGRDGSSTNSVGSNYSSSYRIMVSLP